MPRVGIPNPQSLAWINAERSNIIPPEYRGQKAFCANLLMQTIEDYLKKDILAVEDVNGKNGNGIFSFEHLCKYLNLDPGSVKDRLRTMTLKDWRRAYFVFGHGSRGFRDVEKRIYKPIEGILICPVCYKEFEKRFRWDHIKYCSPKCRGIGYRINRGNRPKRPKHEYDLVFGQGRLTYDTSK